MEHYETRPGGWLACSRLKDRILMTFLCTDDVKTAFGALDLLLFLD